MEGNNQKSKSPATIKNIIKTIMIALIALVFCPTFLVSCSGYEIKVSAMDIVKGLEYNGRELNSGSPFYALTLLLPLTVFIILFIKRINEKTMLTILILFSFINWLVWIELYSALKKAAESSYCEFKATFGYDLCFWLNLFSLALSIFVASKRNVSLETDVLSVLPGNVSTRSAINHVSTAVYKVSDKVSKVAEGISNNAASIEQGGQAYTPFYGKPTENETENGITNSIIHQELKNIEGNKTYNKTSNRIDEKGIMGDLNNTCYMYVCPECKKAFKVKGKEKKVKCPQCDIVLVDTNVMFEDWNTMDKDERTKIKASACEKKNVLMGIEEKIDQSKKKNTITENKRSFFDGLDMNEDVSATSSAGTKCGKCGYNIAGVSSNVKFCPQCGMPIDQRKNLETQLFCPRCGDKQELGAVFCHECGYKIKS